MAKNNEVVCPKCGSDGLMGVHRHISYLYVDECKIKIGDYGEVEVIVPAGAEYRESSDSGEDIRIYCPSCNKSMTEEEFKVYFRLVRF